MKRWFDWTRYDIGFLKRVIAASEMAGKLADMDDDDIIRVAGVMKQICPEPDRNYIVRYRTEIEQGLLRNYPEICKEVFKTMRIPRGSVNERLAKLYAKPTSGSLAACWILPSERDGSRKRICGKSLVMEYDASIFDIKIL